MDKLKRILLIFTCVILFFNLSSCQKRHLTNGIAVECYCEETIVGTTGRTIFYLQGTHKTAERNAYTLGWVGKTPLYVRERAASHFKTDDHEIYKELGQLDDYYIDENIELYLYNKSNPHNSTILYFKDGIQQPLEPTIDGRSLQYIDGSLYLLDLPYKKSDHLSIQAEKIDLSTGESQIITYRLPYCDSPLQTDYYNTSRINSDGSLWTSYADLTPIQEGLLAPFVSCISYPDGKYYTVEPRDPVNHTFRLIFETEQGYGLLETAEHMESSKPGDFFLQIRYVDREGKELGYEDIDCSKILKRLDGLMFLKKGVAYHDGIIYFAVEEDHLYNYTYDLKTKKLQEGAKIKAHPCQEYLIVRIKDGNIYSLY